MEEVFVAKWYHMVLFPAWIRRLLQKPGEFLAEFVQPGMTVADIGCGTGFYTLELARMVGEDGKVLAVDFQPEMLYFAQRNAKKAKLDGRIEYIQCDRDDLKISEPVDFALSMWMTHEVADRSRMFIQIRDILKQDGRYLIAEPWFHVSRKLYETICIEAESAELKKVTDVKVGLSTASLFAYGQ
jgi:ubiquinone/menaquinone biosynthesis C-methylase UbiE